MAVAGGAKDKQRSEFTDSLADMYREQCIQVRSRSESGWINADADLILMTAVLRDGDCCSLRMSWPGCAASASITRKCRETGTHGCCTWRSVIISRTKKLLQKIALLTNKYDALENRRQLEIEVRLLVSVVLWGLR